MSIRKQAGEQAARLATRRGVTSSAVDRFKAHVDAVGDVDPTSVAAPIAEAIDATARAAVAVEAVVWLYDQEHRSDLAITRARTLIAEAGALLAAVELTTATVVAPSTPVEVPRAGD